MIEHSPTTATSRYVDTLQDTTRDLRDQKQATALEKRPELIFLPTGAWR